MVIDPQNKLKLLAQQHKKENITVTKQMFQLICYNKLAPNLCSIRKISKTQI